MSRTLSLSLATPMNEERSCLEGSVFSSFVPSVLRSVLGETPFLYSRGGKKKNTKSGKFFSPRSCIFQKVVMIQRLGGCEKSF